MAGLRTRGRSLLEGLPCGIVISDPDGGVIEANAAAQALLGCERSEIATHLGPQSDWLVAGEDGKELAWEDRPWAQARQNRSAERGRIVQLVPPRQQPVWLQVDSWPELDPEGHLVEVVTTLTDVGALKRAEADLREGEARFRNLFDHSPLGIATLDVEGRFRDANPALEAMLGCSRPDLWGTDFWRCVHPRHRPEYQAMLSEFKAAALERGRWEWLLLRTDGTPVWGSVTVGAISPHEEARTGDPSARWLILTFEDISERRRAEQGLRESREHLLAVVGNAPVALFAVDRSARFVLFEGRGAERLGLPVGPEVIGVSALEAFHRRPEVAGLIRRGLGGEADEEDVLEVGDGEFEVRCSPVLDDKEQVTGLIGVFTDISERRRAEAALQANEAKSRFLADVSHQVRTPLNSILGFSQLLQRLDSGELGDRRRRYLSHIESSGRHLLALVDDILDLSKVESGLIEIVPEDFQALGLAEDAVAQVRPMAEAKLLRLELRGSTASRKVWIRADRRRALQVLLNLLSNAIKFTPKEGRVGVEYTPDGDRVRLTVTDTGMGIPPELSERIRRELAELDSRHPTPRIALGLGLSLSSRLAKLMGGGLEFESEPGQGSRFTLVLPAGTPRRSVSTTG